MSQKLKQNLGLIITAALIVAWTAFIWHNSMEPANISDGRSLRIVDIINQILAPLSIEVSNHIIRKLAHFTEYGINGFLWSLLALQIKKHIKKPIRIQDLVFILIGFIIAFVDELIQSHTPGRSCQFSDMLLDTAGFTCGFIALKLINKIYKVISKSHRPS